MRPAPVAFASHDDIVTDQTMEVLGGLNTRERVTEGGSSWVKMARS